MKQKGREPLAEEEKKGLFKKLFSFGRRRKKDVEPEAIESPVDVDDLSQPSEDAQDEARQLQESEILADEVGKDLEQADLIADDALSDSERAEIEAAEKQASRIEAERMAAEKLEIEELHEAADTDAAIIQADDGELVDFESEPVESSTEDTAEIEIDNTSDEESEQNPGWFKRLNKGLARSTSNITQSITSVFTNKKLDEDTLQDLEDILIQADLGVETAMNITDTLSAQRLGKDVTDEEVKQVMADEITKVLEPVAKPLELDLSHKPHVILVVGVNGSGKTTTIGKLSQKLSDSGHSTLLVAGDTFRAAAIEQLHVWGNRTHADVVSSNHGADAASLAFDAFAQAKEQKNDVMIMDTAGRLQNRTELMDELEKIIRVLKKQDPSAPHTVLLTLDATTGQNALNQVEIFKNVAGVNGLVMTKLDGTARGGILVAIAAKHQLPVYFIGVGEQVEDLEPFEAEIFAKTIAGINLDE